MRLPKILENIDLDEPSAIHHILEYAEKLKDEDEKFMQIIANKFADFKITWEQPWYQKNGTLSKCLKKNRDSEPFRRDKLTTQECELINKNWKELVEEYDIPDTPTRFARHRMKIGGARDWPIIRAKKYVIAYVARGLKRPLNTVLRYFKKYYLFVEKGQYTKTENKIVDLCFQYCHENAPQLLSTILGRHIRLIYKKLKERNCSKELHETIGPWKLKRSTKLLKSLMKHTGLQLEELKNKKFSAEVWSNVKEDLNIPQISLWDHWYRRLHVRLFLQKNVRLHKVRKKIYMLLLASEYKMWYDIDWDKMLEHFPDGMTSHFLYHTAIDSFTKFRLMNRVPLLDSIEHALDRMTRNRQRKHYFKLVRVNSKGNLRYRDQPPKSQ